MEWHSAPNANLTHLILARSIRQLDNHCNGRKVVLLMKPTFLHLLAIDSFRGQPPLQNITIHWLPHGIPDHHLPTHHMISTWKALYRLQLVRWMAGKVNDDQEPDRHRNMFLSIQWMVRCWHLELDTWTIYDSFRHALTKPGSVREPCNADVKEECREELRRIPGLDPDFDVEGFLLPDSERIETNMAEVTRWVVDREQFDRDCAAPSQVAVPDRPQWKMNFHRMMNAMDRLIHYSAFQEDCKEDDIQWLFRMYQKFARLHREQDKLDGTARLEELDKANKANEANVIDR
ncbi:hypothetical protein AWENTII_002048 [Aspergillus wentii]